MPILGSLASLSKRLCYKSISRCPTLKSVFLIMQVVAGGVRSIKQWPQVAA